MRYSTWRLLVGMTLASIYLAVVFAAPPRLALLLLGLLSFVMPAIYAGGVIYARGAARAFWIGTAVCGFFPTLLAMWYLWEVSTRHYGPGFWVRLFEYGDSSHTFDFSELRLFAVVVQVLPLVGGLVGVVMRLAFLPRSTETHELSEEEE